MVVMPVFVKFTIWQQTIETIILKIPSHGISKSKIDFLVTEKYIKAHYQPYIFEIFLWKPVDITKSTCVVTETEIVFHLLKNKKEIWDQLESEIEKAVKIDIRRKVIDEVQLRNEEERKLKVTQNAELKRLAVREQISLDSKELETIKNIKKYEEENALRELKLWEETPKVVDIPNEIKCTENKKFKKSSDRTKYKSIDKAICAPKTLGKTKTIVDKDILLPRKINKPKIQPSIPLPRKNQTINISFTPREFPTPTRESKAQEEEEWLTKQAAARRTAGFDNSDLRPEERNPQWLKAKGDEFFQARNYLGAISAYSEGIKMSKEFVDLYINRSAAHMAVGNLHKTLEDCSKALDIMTPPVAANLQMRAKCLARRGAALCRLGLLKQGAGEIQAASKLLPNNESLKQDLERIRIKIFQNNEEE